MTRVSMRKVAKGTRFAVGVASAIGGLYLVWFQYIGSGGGGGIALLALASVPLVGIASALLGVQLAQVRSEGAQFRRVVASQGVVGIIIMSCCIIISVSANGVDLGRVYVELEAYVVGIVLISLLHNGGLLMIKGVSQAVSTK